MVHARLHLCDRGLGLTLLAQHLGGEALKKTMRGCLRLMRVWKQMSCENGDSTCVGKISLATQTEELFENDGRSALVHPDGAQDPRSGDSDGIGRREDCCVHQCPIEGR